MEIPAEWTRVLNDITKTIPGAVIAGGALRDFIYKRVPKDVDIFVQCESYPQYTEYVKHLHNLAEQHGEYSQLLEKDPEEDDSSEVHGTEIFGIHVFTLGKYTFEVIFIEDDGTPVVDSFDLSINQIHMDKSGRLFYTPAFVNTRETKVVSLVCSTYSPERMTKRIERLQKKYAGFTFPVLPMEDYALDEIF